MFEFILANAFWIWLGFLALMAYISSLLVRLDKRKNGEHINKQRGR